ncbi:MAG: DUF2059 domain-containing protein [Mesorhizobium sp.]|nr:DUF2059 domain-containing protein [Mesorhizobium sp.]MBL8576270.1 DUF2059 domain-containing protein [Mesorhizobium sp.]
MMFTYRVRRTVAALAASAFVVLSSQAFAQDISDTHIKAARAAMASVKATEQYDMLLPAAAQMLKTELIQQNPDLTDLISSTIDEKALALAARRADLEREVALIYARAFSETELNSIATFYSSEAGQKLLTQGPLINREMTRAADIWQRGIQRDLATEVGTSISKIVEAQAKANPQADEPTPEQGAAPQGEAAPGLEGLDQIQ